MKKPETRLTNQILKALRSEGGWWVKIHGGAVQETGIPDILGCYRGRFIALEVKQPIESKRSQASPRQLLQLERIAAAGGFTTVVRSISGAIEILRLVDSDLL